MTGMDQRWRSMRLGAMSAAAMMALGACKQRTDTVITAGSSASPAREISVEKSQVAMFGAGCFWGVESTFRRTPGVLDTAVGYAGGTVKDPTYHQVCTDETGHAEVVRVEFDPSKVSYDALLDVFWKSHDPTQLNRQGPDVGTQYRSVIFAFSPEQEQVAKASLARAQLRFNRPIATQIVPEAPFYRAEEYHQRYLEKRGLEECHLPGGQ